MWIQRWRHCAGDGVEFIPFQSSEAAERFPELPRAQLEQSVHFIATDGSVSRGAEAAFLSIAPGNRFPLWLHRNVPGFAACAEFFYCRVANNRPLLSAATRLLWGNTVETPAYVWVRWLFLRSLGVVYLIAFVSLWTQISGLIGRDGVLPASHFIGAVDEQSATLGLKRFWFVPTFCWFGASDAFLHAQCALGVVFALLLVFNIAPALSALFLWALYLSLATVSGVFLGYQWDALLLETGLLAIFFAPWQLWPRLGREAPVLKLPLWLLRWLLFRLMFSSGVVKLASGDPLWRNLTALDYHYETQPLPTWIGWYAHQLPQWFQKLSTLGMLGIELVVPFLMFLPRRPRWIAFWVFVSLQLCIALTGNYTFFNLLSVVLCLLLLDDDRVRRWIPRRWRGAAEHAAPLRNHGLAIRIQRRASAVFGILVLLLSLPILAGTLRWRVPWPKTVIAIHQIASPLRSMNGYGLFAVMTNPRYEIVIEGSRDGVNWQEYEFKYKPGAMKRRPALVAPHQPRLDWQMWFAALGEMRGNPWFVNLCIRLLQGEGSVIALLEKNPFPDAPPEFVRASFYEYRFTTMAQRRATGAWWKRELKGEYCPPVSLPKGAREAK